MTDTGSFKMKGHSFAMERMMAKDEEERLDRANTKQRRGTPMVRRQIFAKSWRTGTAQAAPSFRMQCSLRISSIKFLLSDVTGQALAKNNHLRICCHVMSLSKMLVALHCQTRCSLRHTRSPWLRIFENIQSNHMFWCTKFNKVALILKSDNISSF